MTNEVKISRAGPDERDAVTRLLLEMWGPPGIVSRGVLHLPESLEAFVAKRAEQIVGLATFVVKNHEMELVTLDAMVKGRGIGTMLIEAVLKCAEECACRKMWLITTNDNVDALRFYQRRGFHLVALHRDAMDLSRTLKPAIPRIGLDQIPLRDEIELAIKLPR